MCEWVPGESEEGVESEQGSEEMWALDVAQEHPAEVAWRGIELCRNGKWQDGLYWLSLAAEADAKTSELPSLLFSYLGFGIAKVQGRHGEGIRVAKLGVELDIHQPESYFLLAETHLLRGDRRSAIGVIENGLLIDASNRGLLELKAQLGLRRRPVLPFLPRRHVLNRWLGKLRHRLLGGRI